jgi:hypothetical protein
MRYTAYMKAKVFGLTCLAQFVIIILTLPIMFAVGLSTIGGECSGTSECPTGTTIGLLVYVLAVVCLPITIGKPLLRRFVGYQQATKKFFMIAGALFLLLVIASMLPFYAGYAGNSSLLIYCLYPLYSLIDYSSKTNIRN